MDTTWTVFWLSFLLYPGQTRRSFCVWRGVNRGNEDHSRRKPAFWPSPDTCAARGYDSSTSRFWRMKNGPLLRSLEGAFDVFVTADKNLRYQQNLSGRRLAIVELPSNRWPLLRPLGARIAAVLDSCRPGDYVVVNLQSWRNRAPFRIGIGYCCCFFAFLSATRIASRRRCISKGLKRVRALIFLVNSRTFGLFWWPVMKMKRRAMWGFTRSTPR